MKRVLSFLLVACSSPPPSSTTAPVMDFESARFFDAPWPSMKRLRDDGTIDVKGFPGPDSALKTRVIDQLGAFGEGFGRNTAAWIRMSDAVDAATLTATSVYLLDLESGAVVPSEVQFKAAQETYSPKNLLVVLPYQGHVMRAGTWHALVVTREVKGADGLPLARAAGLDTLPELERLKTALGATKFAEVAGAAVFRTGSHFERLKRIAEAARAAPAMLSAPVKKVRDEATYSVLEGSLDVPMFQRGDEPYSEGGEMVFDDGGVPVVQRTETVVFALTVPRVPAPAAGFPLLFHVPGSGGGAYSIADRLGPELAARGIASVSFDPNLTGARFPGGGGNGDSFYNVFNPVALRDNHRQLAAEYEVHVRLFATLTLDAALVPEAGAVRFDATRFFVHGHSTGSVVGASIIASNPGFARAALSGAGGSWLYNLVLKQTPMSATLVKAILSYQDADTVDVFDPVLTLAATMWEPIEPMNQAEAWSPRPVLVFEGITDTFYLPRMVNALAMAAKLPVELPALDPDTVSDLKQVGVEGRAPPFSGSGLVQHRAAAGKNGHYVVFDNVEARYQYGCFFFSGVIAAPSVSTTCP